MFRERTVFVVGAGASRELGLPLGSELLQKIQQNLIDIVERKISDALDYDIIHDLYPYGSPTLEQVGIRFANGLSQAASIDNYLYSHAHDAELVAFGKRLICKQLLRAEAESCLAIHDGDFADRTKVSASWLSRMFQILVSKINNDNLQNIFDNVTFISFNYDRCIRQYLVKSIVEYFNIDETSAHNLVMRLKIIHPYGSLGPLPWEQKGRSSGTISFGGTPADVRSGTPFATIHDIAKSIYTFDESMENIGGIRDAIRQALFTSEKIVFLGFAFHEQNMDLLTGSGKNGASLKVYGSAYGISIPTQKEITRRLKSIFPTLADISLSSDKAAQLFEQYHQLI